MTSRILVVDRNEAFAAMLEQMLSTDGGYDVQVTAEPEDALAVLQQGRFDLTILDMDLGQEGGQFAMDYQDMVQEIRGIIPKMRVMLIPLMGQDLPEGAGHLDIQGILSKPFFADDLLPNIEDALAKEVRVSPPPLTPLPDSDPPAESPSEQPAETAGFDLSISNESSASMQPVLSELVRETMADAALFLSVVGEDAKVVAHVSTYDQGRLEILASLVSSVFQSSWAARRFLNGNEAPFEHHMFEGGEVRLYVMTMAPDLLLVAVTPTSTPLGTIRHNMRRAKRQLA